MDTTETYTKMCEKAMLDIKGLVCDIPVTDSNESIVYSGEDIYTQKGIGSTAHIFIPLYRQNQLQEMVSAWLIQKHGDLTNGYMEVYLMQCFSWFMCLSGSYQYGVVGSDAFLKQEEYVRQFTSMEQLWLAFVMKEKYSKTWNGKEWERL